VDVDDTQDVLLLIQQKLRIVQYRYSSLPEFGIKYYVSVVGGYCTCNIHPVGTSDISVSKINSVSITVLGVIGSFKFLLYFYFGKLIRFSFSFQFLNHFYFSFNFSLYFRFRVYYVEDKINSTNVTTTGCDKISIPKDICSSQQLLGISKRNFINIYLFILCTHNVF